MCHRDNLQYNHNVRQESVTLQMPSLLVKHPAVGRRWLLGQVRLDSTLPVETRSIVPRTAGLIIKHFHSNLDIISFPHTLFTNLFLNSTVLNIA
jgi:hypothetical protein